MRGNNYGTILRPVCKLQKKPFDISLQLGQIITDVQNSSVIMNRSISPTKHVKHFLPQLDYVYTTLRNVYNSKYLAYYSHLMVIINLRSSGSMSKYLCTVVWYCLTVWLFCFCSTTLWSLNAFQNRQKFSLGLENIAIEISSKNSSIHNRISEWFVFTYRDVAVLISAAVAIGRAT